MTQVAERDLPMMLWIHVSPGIVHIRSLLGDYNGAKAYLAMYKAFCMLL